MIDRDALEAVAEAAARGLFMENLHPRSHGKFTSKGGGPLATNGVRTRGEYVRPANERPGYVDPKSLMTDAERSRYVAVDQEVRQLESQWGRRYELGMEAKTALKRKLAGAQRRRKTIYDKAMARRG